MNRIHGQWREHREDLVQEELPHRILRLLIEFIPGRDDNVVPRRRSALGLGHRHGSVRALVTLPRVPDRRVRARHPLRVMSGAARAVVIARVAPRSRHGDESR